MTTLETNSNAVTDTPTFPRCWQEPARELSGTGFRNDVRPWNWTELDEHEGEKLWDYLGSFVAFFNARYGERMAHRIPPCWAEHGALVEELTTLAFARWQAFSSVHASIGGAQYWHSYTLPGFYDRLRTWLSDLSRCQQGHHRSRDEVRTDRIEQWLEHNAAVRDADLWLRCGTDEKRRTGQANPFVPYVERRTP